jgi:hypothetical protein
MTVSKSRQTACDGKGASVAVASALASASGPGSSVASSDLDLQLNVRPAQRLDETLRGRIQPSAAADQASLNESLKLSPQRLAERLRVLR